MRAAAGLAPARFLHDFAVSAHWLHLPRETLRILDRIDARTPNAPFSSTWGMRSELMHELADYRSQYELAERARARMPRSLAPILEQIKALSAMQEASRVLALVDTAVSLPIETLMSPGDVMVIAAAELRAHQNHDAFETVIDRAVEWYRTSPATFTKAEPAWHERRLANALYLAGRWDESREIYERLVEISSDWRMSYYAHLGAIAARKGDRTEAERYIALLGTLRIPIDAELYDIGVARGEIAAQLGDADRALQFLIEGYDGPQGVDLHTDIDFEEVIRTHPGFQEFVRPKG
jgi:tetratricopeptide (TPR) repeat protein